MIRKAFVMSIHPGREAEYEARHKPVWSELEETLKSHGVQTYTIFLHTGTCQLFADVEVEDESKWEEIAETSVCRRWWSYMRELMLSNPDDSPVSEELREVFHIERP